MGAKEHLHSHKPAIVVTNACNVCCGGCLQLCGHFPKEKIFYITESQFRKAIEASIFWAKNAWEKMPNLSRFFVIYGGEPTIHPNWDVLVKIMLEYSDYPFIVYTNGHFLSSEIQYMGLVEHTDQKCLVSPLTPVRSLGCYAFRPILRTGNNQTEYEFFSELVNKEGYTCNCGNTYYTCVGLAENANPGPWHEYITVFVKCSNCGKPYQFDTEEEPSDFSRLKKPRRVTAAFRKRLELIQKLPHSASEKHRELLENLATFQTDNIGYRLDFKHKYSVLSYNPVLAAPCDYLSSGINFWNVAQRKCFLWKNCESAIYNGKAYFCSVAAAMDHMLYDGEHGWSIEEGKDFLVRSDAEISTQASKFCHRCGYCFGRRYEAENIIGIKQMSYTKTLASKTNFEEFPKTDRMQLLRKLKWNL